MAVETKEPSDFEIIEAVLEGWNCQSPREILLAALALKRIKELHTCPVTAAASEPMERAKIREELNALCCPLIKYLNEHFHPHVTLIIDTTSYELSEGIIAAHHTEFIKG